MILTQMHFSRSYHYMQHPEFQMQHFELYPKVPHSQLYAPMTEYKGVKARRL